MMKIKALFCLNIVFFLAFGLFLFFQPEMALKTIVIIFGIECLLSWIAGSYLLFKDNSIQDRELLSGMALLQIISGILLLVCPSIWELIVKIFVTIIWIGVIIKWILLCVNSFDARKLKVKDWWWIAVAWWFLVILWLVLVTNSFSTIMVFNKFIWIWLIVAAISMIIWALQEYKTERNIRKKTKKWKNYEVVEIEIEKFK